MVKELLYYTDNTLDGTKLCATVQILLKSMDIPIISVSHRPIDFGRNITYNGTRRQKAILEQIWLGLMQSKADMVYFVEHDCLYHPSHFDLVSDKLTYDDHWYRCSQYGFYSLNPIRAILLSTCFGPRLELIKGIASKLSYIYRYNSMRYVEPGFGTEDRLIDFNRTKASHPMICIRHGKNYGVSGLNHKADFQDCPTWGNYKELRNRLGLK